MKDFRQSYKLKATPEEIFTAFTNPFTIELWSGYPAKMSPEPGSTFEIFDGDISGEIIEIIDNQTIVQEWYFGDQNEKSVVTIMLRSKGVYSIIEINHINIPDDAFEEIKLGWEESVIGGLREFFK